MQMFSQDKEDSQHNVKVQLKIYRVKLEPGSPI